MPSKISAHDGRYALDCWEKEEDVDEPEGASAREFGDDIETLKRRAKVLINSGRFQYVELSRYDHEQGDWFNMFTFSPE